MTAYSVVGSWSSNALAIGITPVTFEIRIISVEFGNVGDSCYVRVSIADSISGGTSYTPNPLRQGAPPASATAKVTGPSASNAKVMWSKIIAEGDQAVGTTETTYPGVTAEFVPPMTTTIAPGKALFINSALVETGDVPNPFATVWFEELRLAGCY